MLLHGREVKAYSLYHDSDTIVLSSDLGDPTD
jgi:hypothetical protein